jgi:hypothetical protein
VLTSQGCFFGDAKSSSVLTNEVITNLVFLPCLHPTFHGVQVDQPRGIFIVRPSQSREGCFALSVAVDLGVGVWTGLIIKEYNSISKKFKCFIECNGAPRFESVIELIDAYRTRDLASVAGGSGKIVTRGFDGVWGRVLTVRC